MTASIYASYPQPTYRCHACHSEGRDPTAQGFQRVPLAASSMVLGNLPQRCGIVRAASDTTLMFAGHTAPRHRHTNCVVERQRNPVIAITPKELLMNPQHSPSP